MYESMMQQHHTVHMSYGQGMLPHGNGSSAIWQYDYSGERSPALEALWDGLDTNWEWGYPEQQQQVGDLMAALIPPDGPGVTMGNSEFQEVASRRRRKEYDPSEHIGVPHVAHTVSVSEMRGMSQFAQKVPEMVTLRLQQLSEEGCNLVEMLDDRAWSALAALSVDEGLQVIGQVAGQLQKTPQQIRNVNAVLMSHAGKHLRDHNARLGGSSMASPAPQAPVPPPKAPAPAKKILPPTASMRPVASAPKRDTGNLATLSPEVQQKARELMQQFGPYLTAQHFDNGIVSVLKQMGDANAQLALEAVKASCSGRGARDWSKLANPSAYIMSIISPYIRRAR